MLPGDHLADAVAEAAQVRARHRLQDLQVRPRRQEHRRDLHEEAQLGTTH